MTCDPDLILILHFKDQKIELGDMAEFSNGLGFVFLLLIPPPPNTEGLGFTVSTLQPSDQGYQILYDDPAGLDDELSGSTQLKDMCNRTDFHHTSISMLYRLT